MRENPGMLDIWDALSRSLFRLYRYEESIEAAKEALRISPSTPHFAVLIANASLELDRFDDARAHVELVLDREPAQAREILARVHLERREFDEAKRQAELALQSRRDRISTLLTLARIENERNQTAEALRYCDQVAALASEHGIEKVRRLQFNRGDALARAGRHREAEAAFREEIRLFPRDPQSYKNPDPVVRHSGPARGCHQDHLRAGAGRPLRPRTWPSPKRSKWWAIRRALATGRVADWNAFPTTAGSSRWHRADPWRRPTTGRR